MALRSELHPVSTGGSAVTDPTTGIPSDGIFDDLQNYQFSAATGPLGLAWFVNGTAAQAKLDPTSTILNRVGLVQFQTGTTLTANATVCSSLTDIQLGGATVTFGCACKMEAVPGGTENFLVKAGLINTFPGAQNGVYFTADRTLSTTNWQAVTVQGSTSTVADTGIALDTNFHNFRLVVNGNTNAQFYIDGVLVATNSTNLPVSNGQAVGIVFSIQKVGGTASQNVDLDWVYYKYVMGSPRGTF